MPIQETNNLPKNDPRHHALNIAQGLREIAQHTAEDVNVVDSGHGILRRTADKLNEMADELEEFGYQKERA